MHPFKKGYMSAIEDLLEEDIGRSLLEEEKNKISEKYSEFNDSQEFKNWLEDYKDDLYKNNVRIYTSELLDQIFEEEEMRVKDNAKEEMVRILTDKTLNIINDLTDIMTENSRKVLTEEDVKIFLERNKTDLPWFRREVMSNLDFVNNEEEKEGSEDLKEIE